LTQAFYDWRSTGATELEPGHLVWVVTGTNLQVIKSEIEPGSEFAIHSHPHEQIIFVMNGQFEFTVGGSTRTVEAGGALCIAPGVDHGGRAVGLHRLVLVEAFTPPRVDYVDTSAPPDQKNPR
jgi:quercetin dioxygenase-like cupin family protein